MSLVPVSSRCTLDSLWVRMAARVTGRRAVAVLVAGLVLGILGMHALANHGAPASPVTASSTMSMTGAAAVTSAHEAAASGSSHDGHAHSTATQSSTAAPRSSVDVGADPGPGSGHGIASMVMLCVVMLAAAALTLLTLLSTGSIRRLQPETFMPAAVRERALQWVRGTGPPHEWQFSVIRC